MIFISRYKNYKLGIRPTIKQVVHGSTGSEEVITHKGVTVEFQDAAFDTKKWRDYSRPNSPAHIDVIRSEEDLIRLMEASPYYGTDFFARGKEETVAEKRARLHAELARIDAEEAAADPANAPTMDFTQPEITISGQKPKEKTAKPKKTANLKKNSKQSKINL